MMASGSRSRRYAPIEEGAEAEPQGGEQSSPHRLLLKTSASRMALSDGSVNILPSTTKRGGSPEESPKRFALRHLHQAWG